MNSNTEHAKRMLPFIKALANGKAVTADLTWMGGRRLIETRLIDSLRELVKYDPKDLKIINNPEPMVVYIEVYKGAICGEPHEYYYNAEDDAHPDSKIAQFVENLDYEGPEDEQR